MTQVLSPTPEALALASQLLHDGQLVAFPTETVYGLGANALDAKAVLNIFAAKGRPADNPLIVHVYDRAQLTPLCEVSPLAEKLMDAFWPGPLTLILPRKPAIPDEVAASLPTVAVRMPSHPVAAALGDVYKRQQRSCAPASCRLPPPARIAPASPAQPRRTMCWWIWTGASR